MLPLPLFVTWLFQKLGFEVWTDVLDFIDRWDGKNLWQNRKLELHRTRCRKPTTGWLLKNSVKLSSNLYFQKWMINLHISKFFNSNKESPIWCLNMVAAGPAKTSERYLGCCSVSEYYIGTGTQSNNSRTRNLAHFESSSHEHIRLPGLPLPPPRD